jgi:Fe-S-cluster containining protein
MEIDLSELGGRSYSCLDGCALCCLCQPEVSPDELRPFAMDPRLAPGLTCEHFDGHRTERPSTFKLQGGHGACHFLRARRCQVYAIRPRLCRQFPVHVHLLRRVQLNANLSCRGIAAGGASLAEFGRHVLDQVPRAILAGELHEAQRRARGFERACRDADVHQSPERLAAMIARILPSLRGEEGIGRLLGFADEEPEVLGMPVDKVAALVENSEVPEDLEEVAQRGNFEQLELAELAWLPVYADERLHWNVFQSRDGKVRWMALEEDGSLELRAEYNPSEVRLLPRSSEALAIWADYAALLARRDHFLGYASQVCADQGYGSDMAVVYLGVLGTTLLDLWWRASLVGKMTGKTEVDAWLAREGIIAYDMDCLDALTIGAFI